MRQCLCLGLPQHSQCCIYNIRTLTGWLTTWLSPCYRVFFKTLLVLTLSSISQHINGTGRFIRLITQADNISHLASLRCILIFSSHLSLRLQAISGFPIEILYAFLVSHVARHPCHVFRQSRHPWFVSIKQIFSIFWTAEYLGPLLCILDYVILQK
jgi:hypothetical protein